MTSKVSTTNFIISCHISTQYEVIFMKDVNKTKICKCLITTVDMKPVQLLPIMAVSLGPQQ